jgi:OmcA/MtrC family decaheme c-type cytochrome
VTGTNNKADLGDLTYDASLTHRLTIQISGNAPGTGTNTPNGVQTTPGVPMTAPVDVVYDFIPATGQPPGSTNEQRNMTIAANCDSCHSTLGGIPGDSEESSAAGFHGGSRNNVQYCVVCHTDQRRYGRTEATYNASTMTFTGSTYVVDGRAVGNLPNMIHKTHLGHKLVKQAYNYGGVEFNHVGYSQDIRNCTKCHDGTSGASGSVQTPQGDNWTKVPSRLACGACHDGINFATGTGVTLKDAAAGKTVSEFGHVGGAQSDDSTCAVCHKADLINTYHLPVTPPNKGSSLHVAGGNNNTNAAWLASNQARLPAGAIKVTYEIKSVSRNASKQPVLVFRMLQNGARKDLNVFASAAVNPASGAKEVWDNFMGSPSAYFVWAVPQDGITDPADFNATASGYLRSIWNGTATGTGAGTLSGPDADGFYTVTLTGAVVADNAKMLTGGVGYSYNVSSTLPLTQTNVAGYPVPDGSGLTNPSATNKTGGLVVIAPNVQRVATSYTARRAIVEDKRCNACHQELGAFTEEAFHGGQRNDGTTCSWCHTPNRTSSGWSADSIAFVHAIHAAAKRSVPYNWHAVSATDIYGNIGYPGILARCEQCHLPGTYSFTAAGSAAVVDPVDRRQYRTVATGTLSPSISLSPYVTTGVNYGSGPSFSAATGLLTEAAATTLVTSPFTTACTACHDSSQAIAHMEANGGSFYRARSEALPKLELCLVCHGSGRIAAIEEAHAR